MAIHHLFFDLFASQFQSGRVTSEPEVEDPFTSIDHHHHHQFIIIIIGSFTESVPFRGNTN
jgi:hypothetical protein